MVEIRNAREFAAAFVGAMNRDLADHPPPLIVSPAIVLRDARARVTRATVSLLARAGARGILVSFLRHAYQALEVESPLADAIERALVADGIAKLDGDRLVWCADKHTWKKLVAERVSA